MTNEEAIETIKANYPPSRYTMLREALNMSMEALENTPQVDNNGLLVVRVDSVEELDKVNEVLVRVKGEAWGKFFAEEDCGDD